METGQKHQCLRSGVEVRSKAQVGQFRASLEGSKNSCEIKNDCANILLIIKRNSAVSSTQDRRDCLEALTLANGVEIYESCTCVFVCVYFCVCMDQKKCLSLCVSLHTLVQESACFARVC